MRGKNFCNLDKILNLPVWGDIHDKVNAKHHLLAREAQPSIAKTLFNILSAPRRPRN